MSLGYMVTLITSVTIGGIMLCAGLLSVLNASKMKHSFLQFYQRGVHRDLHLEIAARSAAYTASGLGLGMLLTIPLVFLPWPRGLLLIFPLWIPILGGGAGYVLAWWWVQRRALTQARTRGELQVDLTVRTPSRYLKPRYFLVPWFLLVGWTALLFFLLQPAIGRQVAVQEPVMAASTITLAWIDLLLAPLVGILVIILGWLLLLMVTLAPRALPVANVEQGAMTDDIMRQETVAHVHSGIMGVLALLLLGPTSLIADPLLQWGSMGFLLLVAKGLLSAPTLFQRALRAGKSEIFDGEMLKR